jgi:hypothetical protein
VSSYLKNKLKQKKGWGHGPSGRMFAITTEFNPQYYKLKKENEDDNVFNTWVSLKIK